MPSYLGMGKTLFNSSACLLTWPPTANNAELGDSIQIELALSERLTRLKATGAWPEKALSSLSLEPPPSDLYLCENRDFVSSVEMESLMNQEFPFFEYLKNKNLTRFSSHFNKDIQILTHHLAHAYAALTMAPFEKSLLIVVDGAGSKTEGRHEAYSVFLQDKGQLKCVEKGWQTFSQSNRHANHFFSEGLGSFYEKISEYIFNSKRAAGKVMGLASFGKPKEVNSRIQFLEELDWNQAFRGKSKSEWESCNSFQRFSDLAATAQSHFEKSLLTLISDLKDRFSDYRNLILTGGCALNCTTNMILFNKGWFKEIYIPPFPGDECIGLGCASYLLHNDEKFEWRPWPHEIQQGYFGPSSSAPDPLLIERLFAGYKIAHPQSITEFTADLLTQGHILGWFQGRSESGPRALGNRSILARPDQTGLKDRLNATIKFREAFRPYGCSVTQEKASDYFEVPPHFNNPYMSFATRTRSSALAQLKEVTHVDGTSRMQTVCAGQNRRFFELLQAFGRRTGLYCLLNTSLNIMGEPIVETVQDAKAFLDTVPVFGIAIGDYFVWKKTE